MAEKLKKYLEEAKKSMQGIDEEIIFHRLCYLTGKQLLDSVDELEDDATLLKLMKESMQVIHQKENFSSVASFTEGYTLADSDKEKEEVMGSEKNLKNNINTNNSVNKMILPIKKSKKTFRYQIGKESFFLTSSALQQQLHRLAANFFEEKIPLKKQLAEKIANAGFLFSDSSFHPDVSPVERFETGLFVFKKIGWGDFFLLEKEPYRIAWCSNLSFDNFVEKEYQNFFIASFLQGICCAAHRLENSNGFLVEKISSEMPMDAFINLSEEEQKRLVNYSSKILISLKEVSL